MKQGERLAAVSEGGGVKRDPIVDYGDVPDAVELR